MPETEGMPSQMQSRPRTFSSGGSDRISDPGVGPSELEKLEQMLTGTSNPLPLPEFFPALPTSPSYTTLPESLTKPQELHRAKSSPLQLPPLIPPQRSPQPQVRRITPAPDPQPKRESPQSPGLDQDSMHKMLTATMPSMSDIVSSVTQTEKSFEVVEFPLSPPPPFTMEELTSSTSPLSLLKFDDLMESSSFSTTETVTSTPASDSVSSFLSSPLPSHDFDFDFPSQLSSDGGNDPFAPICSPTSSHILSPIHGGDSDDMSAK